MKARPRDQPKTAIERLAYFVAETEIAPDTETICIVRDALIDTLGCILAGASQPVAQQTQLTLSSWGSGLARALGTSLHLATPWAAMANAVAGHALDFDDWEMAGNTHPSVVMFPALLAVAADRPDDQPVAGQAILEGYVAGFEVIARIGEAVNLEHYARGWHSTATIGSLGSAAAVARLMGLNRRQTAHALSISLSQAVGYTCQFGTDAKALQSGFAAKTGVLATSLAQNGLTGQAHVLEANTGFHHLMGHGDVGRLSEALDRIGAPLALKTYGLGVKPYLCCSYTHRVMDCAIALRARPGFDPDAIKCITVSLPDFHAAILPFHQPKDRAEALFSAPCCVAIALLHGQLTLAHLEAEAWTNATVVDLIDKMTVEHRDPKNPTLNYDDEDPDWVAIEMHDGTRYGTEVALPLGTPPHGMTSDQILKKFWTNAAWLAEASPHRHSIAGLLRRCLKRVA